MRLKRTSANPLENGRSKGAGAAGAVGQTAYQGKKGGDDQVAPLSQEALSLLKEVDQHLSGCATGGKKISANNVKHALRSAKFDATAASPELIAALDAVITKHKSSMDDTALSFSSSFSQAVVADQMEDAAFQMRFQEMQKMLANNVREFTAHYTEFREEKAERNFEAFRADLGEKRLEVSEWQSTMLFLMTGHRQSVTK